MGVLLMALTVTLSLARQGLAHRLRRALPYVQRVSGGIMVLMGAYLTWYGIFEIRLQTSTPEGSAPVDLVTGWSASISDWINRVDAVRVGLVLALLLVLAVLVALLRSGPTDEEPAAPAESETHREPSTGRPLSGATAATVRRMDLRIFTEPQQGASYDDLLAVARPPRSSGFDAFFRSDHYLKMGDVTGLPGPTDAWITLAGLARGHQPHPARHARHLGDVPPARAARDRGGARSTR